MKTSNQLLDAPDKPPVLLVLVIVTVTFVFVFVSWFLSQVLLEQTTNKVSASVDTGMANQTRLTYIQDQTNYLNSSQSLSDGSSKISIEDAMREVVQNQEKNKRQKENQ